jgi:hypothetical protein
MHALESIGRISGFSDHFSGLLQRWGILAGVIGHWLLDVRLDGPEEDDAGVFPLYP